LWTAVFQPFFSTKEEGTGLGLAIAKRIMEEHGGYIHIRPGDRGQGASFVLVLPVRENVWLRS
jgi:Signal transduction histidine kinase involved in nitrogen fixation and metabolism regulation